MGKISVIDKNNESSNFEPKRIFNALIRETDIDKEYAKKITKRVARKVNQLKKNGANEVSTNQIRSLVNASLLKDGALEEEKKHERIGISIADVKRELEDGNRSNSNISKSAESIHKYVADLTLKQLFLREMPLNVARAHSDDSIHLHDAEYGVTRPNCLNHDLRYFLEHGLDISGAATHASVSRPAKRLMAALNQALQIAGVSQTQMSGGQGLQLFSPFLAPYAHEVDDEELYQSIESFIYSANQNFISRGGQAVFLSVGLHLTIPKFLENVEAIQPGGIKNGDTYGNFEEDNRRIQRAFTSIMKRKDGVGKPFPWPNTIYYLDKKAMEMENDLLEIMDASSTIGFPYFANLETDGTNLFKDFMGCRSSLGDNWTGDWERDCLRTGNLTMTTMNLPRIAYESRDEDELFENFEDVIQVTRESLLARRELILKALYEYKLSPFLMQEQKGDRYYRWEDATLSFGFVGLQEMVKSLCGEGLESPDGEKLGHKVMDYLSKRVNEFKKEENLRYSIIATPGESTVSTFALKDLKLYPEKIIYNGNKEAAYYSNSCQLPSNTQADLLKKIQIESKFFPNTTGGNIGHVWLGMTPDKESLLKLTKGVLKTPMDFFAYTRDYSYCLKCQTATPGLIEKCGCGEEDEIEQFSRICGYYSKIGNAKSATSGWSNSKRRELKDRTRVKV